MVWITLCRWFRARKGACAADDARGHKSLMRGYRSAPRALRDTVGGAGRYLAGLLSQRRAAHAGEMVQVIPAVCGPTKLSLVFLKEVPVLPPIGRGTPMREPGPHATDTGSNSWKPERPFRWNLEFNRHNRHSARRPTRKLL